MSDEEIWFGCGFCCCCVLLPMIIMISVSFQKIDTNEVGLRQNRHFGYKAGEEVEQAGLHYVGLWHTFVKASKTDQLGSYSITAFTENVIQVDMDVSIQYQVEPTYTNLYNIMFAYDSMPRYFNSRVEDAVRRGIQSLQSDVMYSNRALVTSRLNEKVTPAIAACGYSLNNLQVTEIVVPAEMQEAIDDMVEADLDVDVAEQERDKSLQDAGNQKNRDVHAATIDADLMVQTAYADYNASITVLDAELYKLERDVQNTEQLVRTYMRQFPTLQPKQIMELVKNHRYNMLMASVGGSGSNKVILNHKPVAASEIGDQIMSRIDGAYEANLTYTPYEDTFMPTRFPTVNPTQNATNSTD